MSDVNGNGKFLVGIFDDDDVVLSAVKEVKGAGVRIQEVYSPFPIHGLDVALGHPRSRLGIAAFLFGLSGTLTALALTYYTEGFDWPMIVGGKDSYSPVIYVPIIFELTVLFCALGMVGTFLISNGMGPTVKPLMYDLRTTDNKFAMAIDLSKNSIGEGDIEQILRKSGAAEVNIKQF
ncbi:MULTISPECIES: DUF3341 domain-containing protein [Spirosoma]|uniref:Quinol:cytochrome c oxidoreductase membrane protein n=1 Tax=Spirosoma linguale (strain ATCC 33905 / DSM 74 / LMG 10896 / Claus 1) TaxID=504472 RepID=D2QS50_SPILD|nr:DUF3341 domain-containing protein [Spirosoma sp.]ADB41632.1 conserved hypothetical protein [Spirosoma linguale DSM 74]MCX6213441.1 DUF3341 domain-containing protein [Spirosoma sp.]